MRKSKIEKIGKEEVEKIINTSSSIREVLQKIGLSCKGTSNYVTIKEFIKKWNLDISKLEDKRKKQAVNISRNKRKFEDIFCEDSKVTRVVAKRRIINDNLIPYICRDCGNSGKWNNKQITLQLEHINGISNDNRLENLCFLCPNCHSQTETWGNKNNLLV